MQIKGKLIKVLPLQSGEGKVGTWKKQEFVIETEGNYPKKICLSLWGDKINMLQGKENQIVMVDFDLESREYNGRWYTEVKAWKIESVDVNSNTSDKDEDLDWLDHQNNEDLNSDSELPF